MQTYKSDIRANANYKFTGYEVEDDLGLNLYNASAPAASAQEGLKYLISSLSFGEPVIAGVDYQSGSPNYDGMTDHFVTVSSMTESLRPGLARPTGRYFNFFDPRTRWGDLGTSSANRFSTGSNYRMTGAFIHYRDPINYTVTKLRRNQY